MKIAIAGASGMIGCAFGAALRAAGHEVVRLVRRLATRDDEIRWDPTTGEWDATRWRGIDAVVNLAGENIAAGRWTAARRERILRSRVDATRTLVRAMRSLDPRPRVFLSASAVGFYGDRGDEWLTEASAIGNGFLPEVCLAWETHADGAARDGVRTVLLRFGTVLAAKGGALGKMLPLFRVGLGGPLGSGQQWMSWIALDDAVGAMAHALNNRRCAGPLNFVSPEPVTNAEFALTLGRVLHRPARLRAPGWALRAAFGRMADEALLASTRAAPEKLRASGYAFRHATLESALRAALRD